MDQTLIKNAIGLGLVIAIHIAMAMLIAGRL
jgi:hypothetical protein